MNTYSTDTEASYQLYQEAYALMHKLGDHILDAIRREDDLGRLVRIYRQACLRKGRRAVKHFSATR